MPNSPSIPCITELAETDSTNNFALKLVRRDNVKNGHAILANHQTAGQGQRGKTWMDEHGKGLNLSICLQPNKLHPQMGFQLLATTAVAVCNQLMKTTGHPFQIKWPNDLYQNGKKAGGILIQNLLKGEQWEWAIVGIGINVQQEQFHPHLPNAISLHQITGLQHDVKSLAMAIREEILQVADQLYEKGFAPFYSAYTSLLYKKEKTIRLKHKEVVVEGILKGVTENGHLHVENETSHLFQFGEVEWLH